MIWYDVIGIAWAVVYVLALPFLWREIQL